MSRQGDSGSDPSSSVHWLYTQQGATKERTPCRGIRRDVFSYNLTYTTIFLLIIVSLSLFYVCLIENRCIILHKDVNYLTNIREKGDSRC